MTPRLHQLLRVRYLRLAAFALFALWGVVAAFAMIAPHADFRLPSTGMVVEQVAVRFSERVLSVPARYLREERYARGDTLAGLMTRLGIDPDDAKRLVGMRALHLLRPGYDVAAEVEDSGRLLRLDYPSAGAARISVTREGDVLKVSEQRPELTSYTAMKSGEIRSSLFAAADAGGIPESVAMQLADIFGGDVDFHRDLRQGDRFSVIYEMQHIDGRPARAGRVTAAEFVSQGRRLRAVYYPGSEGIRTGSAGYYGPDGLNLRKAFLRSPLEFSRVTSGFGLRKHPIFGNWRTHAGIDYGAPTGTRVRATGDGMVEFVGLKDGYGKVVILRHSGQYSTVYAHLSAFAQGLQRGLRVAQGDIIGRVGQSGWATGPHLHYEFRISGQSRNPLSIALPAANPLPPQEVESFRIHTAPLLVQLDLLAGTNLALLE